MCGFLRFPAPSKCLALQRMWRMGKNQQFSANICLLFPVCHLRSVPLSAPKAGNLQLEMDKVLPGGQRISVNTHFSVILWGWLIMFAIFTQRCSSCFFVLRPFVLFRTRAFGFFRAHLAHSHPCASVCSRPHLEQPRLGISETNPGPENRIRPNLSLEMLVLKGLQCRPRSHFRIDFTPLK